jgi:ribulose-5-phosphate 4-epimerase/fuculose-1-phosphate aldolase
MNIGAAGRLVLDATGRLYSNGMNTTLSGNVSHRIGSGNMVITPSGLDKARIGTSKLSLVGIGSERLVRGPKQSSEYHVHTRLYRALPEVTAVVHPHAPYSMGVISALGARRVVEEISGSDEEYGYYVTSVASVGRMKAGTVEIGDAVASAAKKGAKVIIMEDHGTVGIGDTMQKALDRVEYFEYMVKKLHIRHIEELYARLPGRR